jgi:hypothetical protein
MAQCTVQSKVTRLGNEKDLARQKSQEVDLDQGKLDMYKNIKKHTYFDVKNIFHWYSINPCPYNAQCQ